MIISGKQKINNSKKNSHKNKKVTKSENGDKAKESIASNNILRVGKLDEIIGREEIKKKLRILINSAKSRCDSLEHILFYGPPGLGKTTFGYAISIEFGSKFIITSGPSLNSKAEIASIITNMNDGDILFIDEIHRLNKVLEEFLYPILEDFKMDISFGKGNLSKYIRLDVPKFTLIGATTQIGLISSPLRDRFGMIFKLDFFTIEELTEITIKSAHKLNVKIDKDAAIEIAKRSRGTARIAIRYLKQARDYAYHKNQDVIGFSTVIEMFSEMDVDEYGLDTVMRKYLETILYYFQGGPVGLSNIAASIYEDELTIQEVYEPYLIKVGFLKRTRQGRLITDKGAEYISNLK